MNRWMLGASALVLLASGTPVQAQANWQEKLRINGFANFEWEYSPTPVGRGDKNGSFDAKEFDLVLNFLPNDRVRFATDLRWEHGVATETGRGNAELEYGFIELTAADWFKVRFGKQLAPFGIYNEIHTATPTYFMFKEPLSTNKQEKMGFGQRFFERFQSGIQAVGNVSVGGVRGDYSVMVSNGETRLAAGNLYEVDDNKNKATMGRIRVRPVESLSLTGSYYHDVFSEYDATGGDTGLRAKKRSYGTSLQWRPGNFWTELEWTQGTWTPSSGVSQKGVGTFAVASYEFGERFRPYVEWQKLDPNTNLDDDSAMLFGPGLGVKVSDVLFKFQVDRYNSGAANTRFKGVNYTELVAAVTMAF